MSKVLYFAERARPFYRAMMAQRVTKILRGASNVGQDGFGFDLGQHVGLSAKGIPMYGTARLTSKSNDSTAAYGHTYLHGGSQFGSGSGASVHSSDFLYPRLNAGSGQLAQYTYLAPGSDGAAQTVGLIFQANSLLGHASRLRFHAQRGMIDDADHGQWRDSIRLEQSPWTVLHDRGVSSSFDGTNRAFEDSFDVAAGVFDSTLPYDWRCYRDSNKDDVQGGYWEAWKWIENKDRPTGFCVCVDATIGGVSTRTLKSGLDLAPQAERVLQLLRFHNPPNQFAPSARPLTIICLRVDQGEKSDTQTDTPDEHETHLNALIDQAESDVVATERDPTEFGIEVVTPHTNSAASEATMGPIRTRTMEVVADRGARVWGVDIAPLSTEAQMLTDGWYRSAGADKEHLSEAGYTGLGTLEVAAVFDQLGSARKSSFSPTGALPSLFH